MTPKDLQDYAITIAEKFGYKQKKDEASKGNAIFRSNLNDPKDANYFGFIRPEEPYSSAYSDFSLVIFTNDSTDNFFISLGVGSQGFTNDYALATLPGTRRGFLKLLDNSGKSFCKESFLDIENTSEDLAMFVGNNCPEFLPMVEKYGTCLPVVRFLNSNDPQDLQVLEAWIAQYANLRNWATRASQKSSILKALKPFVQAVNPNELDDIRDLLKSRKYVVLQGAPGTGKTYRANQIADLDYKKDNVFFEQFHAETSYSDFVYGIEPQIGTALSFKEKKGVLYRAIERAQQLKKEGSEDNVLLIIDEINRANLSNVLGPVFYLFERSANSRAGKVKIGNLNEIDILPDNIQVIATMNTADRSLAVVDFALRRRFAWYTLRPRRLVRTDFDDDMYTAIDRIFTLYATDEELNLQPGQSYFIYNDSKDKEQRIIYELMPLIKEYLSEGYMPKAKESFSNLFQQVVKKHLFE